MITLSGPAATAADVNKSVQITSFDTFYLLQKTVDTISLPFPGAGVVWDFSPLNRIYSGLSANQTGQNFTAILLGDASGNWSPAGQQSLQAFHANSKKVGGAGSLSPQPITVALRLGNVRSNETRAWLLLKAPEPSIYSVDLTLQYDPPALLKRIEPGPLAGTLALALNTNQTGNIRAAFAGAVALQGVGGLLMVSLTNGDGAVSGLRTSR